MHKPQSACFSPGPAVLVPIPVVNVPITPHSIQAELLRQISTFHFLEQQMELSRVRISQLQQVESMFSSFSPPAPTFVEPDSKQPIEQESKLKVQGSYACHFNGCGELLNSRFALKRHITKHTGKPFICPFKDCAKGFPESSTLKRHIRVHTGERPFRCRFCDKTFADATNVKRHEMIHTGERPYGCPVENCDRRFSRGSNLKQHMMSVHSLPGDSPVIVDSIQKIVEQRLQQRRRKAEPDLSRAPLDDEGSTTSSETSETSSEAAGTDAEETKEEVLLEGSVEDRVILVASEEDAAEEEKVKPLPATNSSDEETASESSISSPIESEAESEEGDSEREGGRGERGGGGRGERGGNELCGTGRLIMTPSSLPDITNKVSSILLDLNEVKDKSHVPDKSNMKATNNDVISHDEDDNQQLLTSNINDHRNINPARTEKKKRKQQKREKEVEVEVVRKKKKNPRSLDALTSVVAAEMWTKQKVRKIRKDKT